MRTYLIVFVLSSIVLSACSVNLSPAQPSPTPEPSDTPEVIAVTLDVTAESTEPLRTPSPQPDVTATMPQIREARPPVCEGKPQSRLIVYERGMVTENDESLNVRSGPSTSFRILTRLAPGDVFYVLDGPECSDTYVWYRVRFRSIEGWLAEGDFETYYAEPYLPG